MRSTLTERGQTVNPAAVRRHFGLTPADRLEWVIDGDSLRVMPVKATPSRPSAAAARAARRRASWPSGAPTRNANERWLLDTSALPALRDDEAGAWIAACAELADATLVRKDPEYEALALPQRIPPYKAA